ncbi:MAG: hypothetical protein IPO43_19190 [Rhodoferax sp.]|nr:hypothetical protein [Rhodoferax sp.]
MSVELDLAFFRSLADCDAANLRANPGGGAGGGGRGGLVGATHADAVAALATGFRAFAEDHRKFFLIGMDS